MNIIVVSEQHRMPAPLLISLGTHTLVITSDYGEPSAFELVAPSVHEMAILDHEEAYRLHQCLHMLFVTPGCESSD